MMKTLSDFSVLVGRILFALLFVTAAPRHFTQEGIQHAADLGVPLAQIAVPLSGVMAIVGGLMIAAGFRARWGAWILVAFLVPVTAMMHAFWTLHDPQAIHIQQAMFGKNLSMIGALLLMAHFGSGPYSWSAK